ncbi:MAG: hypothetical protein WCX65_06925 [bacterium]
MKKTRMKAITATALIIAAAAAFACFAHAAGTSAIRTTRITIDALDTMNYDGELLDLSYSLDSKCRESSHETYVELTVNKTTSAGKKIVNSATVDIYDEAPENGCNGSFNTITVTSSVNIATAIDKELATWQKNGYKIAADFYVVLPPLSRPVRGGRPGSIHAGVPSYGGTPSHPVTMQNQVKVTYIDYQQQWKCLLYKRDGARKDGFTGTGTTIDQARQGAVQGCLTTNNPYCQQYSTDPTHTTCTLDIQEVTRDEFVAPNAMPTNAVVQWACLMKDGSGANYKGTAATEDAARDTAAQFCKNKGVSGCDNYAFDTGYTTCEQAAVVAKPKPSLKWVCTLYKRDGSRKDGFNGVGSTEVEARNATISGCNTTNNPYCNQYAMDPAHTPCNVELVYPQ